MVGVRCPHSHWTRSRECDGYPGGGRDLEFFILAELMNGVGEARAPEFLGQSVPAHETPL